MNEGLYDSTKASVLTRLVVCDDQTAAEQLRHAAHDATFEIFRAACRELRKHPDLDLAQALFIFGERP